MLTCRVVRRSPASPPAGQLNRPYVVAKLNRTSANTRPVLHWMPHPIGHPVARHGRPIYETLMGMKGIIFNLAEEVVRRTYGEDMWDAILEGARLEGSWTSLGSYPDAHLGAVVASAAALIGVDDEVVLRNVAEGSIPLLAQRYPHFFTPHADLPTFLLTLNEIIHAEVLKLYPGATPPTFGIERSGNDHITLSYGSPRRLCALAEGFIQGAAGHYGQVVTITQPSCMLHGADNCLIVCHLENVAT